MNRLQANMDQPIGLLSRWRLPAHEMLADLLLELHQPDEAVIAYTAALKEASARLNALAGEPTPVSANLLQNVPVVPSSGDGIPALGGL